MTRIPSSVVQRISTTLLAMALSACTSTGPAMTSADPAKSAENQKKQAELQQLEAVGQRNDIDPPLK
jgi:hypothetical protein